MGYKLRNHVNRKKMEELGFDVALVNGDGAYVKVLSQTKYPTGDEDSIVLAIGFGSGARVKKYKLTSYFNNVYDTRRRIIRKKDIVGLEEIIVDTNLHICLQPSFWWRYIIPKRLTLKCHKPIYKWLCFILSKGE